MNVVYSNEIKKVFKLLNENQVEYILMRNIDNELPNDLEIGKDIDLLIKDKKAIVKILKNNNFKKITHPHQNNIFLYGVEKFEFYKNDKEVLFDLNFQIAVRSLDAGQWIPLDETIQISAWKNRRFEQQSEDFGYWTLSYDDEFISLVARSIFDKKEFQDGYIKRINELQPLLGKEEVVKKLNMVFFKFTPYLLEMIEKQEFDKIITNYLQFKEY